MITSASSARSCSNEQNGKKSGKKHNTKRTEDPPSADAVGGSDVKQYLVEDAGREEEEKKDVETNQNGPQAPYSSSSASSTPVNINRNNNNNNTDHVVHNNIQLSRSKILVLLAALLFLVFAVGFCGGLAGSVIMINTATATTSRQRNPNEFKML
jgi:hypothetical protein